MRILAFVFLAVTVHAQQPVRLIAEAEDFTVKSGWKVTPYRENYFASTFAITFLSRMGCLMADGNAAAEQVIDVPVADEYDLLARYEQPFNFACEFTVEVEQAGQTTRYVFGKRDDPKIWAMNRNQPAPMVRYWWGATDNIVWQTPGKVKLAAGKATLRLLATPQPAQPSVDVLLLTNDQAGRERQLKQNTYLPFDGWLTQAGDLFVRFTNPQDATNAVVPVVAPFNEGQHSPYFIHLRDWGATKVFKTGQIADPLKYQLAGPRSARVDAKWLAPVLSADGEPLQPGDRSGWVPMGQVVDALHDCIWQPKVLGKEKAYLKLEFAVPDGQGGLRPVKELTTRGDAIEIPGNIAANPALTRALQERFWLPEIRTQTEALEWLNTAVKKFPPKGPTAKRFLIYGVLGFGNGYDFPVGRELGRSLGDNTTGQGREVAYNWRGKPNAPQEKPDLTGLRVLSYGDEMHLPAAKLSDEEFAAWLKTKGVQPPGPVSWTTSRTDPLYYYSVIAGVEKGAQPYIAATKYHSAGGVLSGANYSPHSNYMVTELHWVRPFKMQALSLAWSEDYVWQVPEFSVQVVGYEVTGFRCGTKYHDQPIMMYVMPHSPGNTPSNFRRSFYTCLAHGMKMVNYFCGSPLAVGGTENYVATGDLPMWREIYNVSHEAGIFEDYVMDGHVRAARVGLLLSSVDDVLGDFKNNNLALHNNERKAIYYALRHAQVPVDMLSEDDVIDGLAQDYQVIYVTQQWMHSKCTDALKKWVERGGTLVALCGGGFKDEFNRPNPKANELYGVSAQEITTDPQLISKYLLVEDKPFLTKQDLPVYEPIDIVNGIPVIAWKQNLTPSTGKVTGTYKDGKPAIIETAHGKGKVVLFGFLPGQAYLKSGLPVRPVDRSGVDSGFDHFLPTAMDVSLRQRIVNDFLPKDFAPPVTCSETLVESTVIDSPGKLGIPLINYTGKPIAKLTVTIAGKTKTIRSIEHGKLNAKTTGEVTTVELPLDVADMLLIDR